jgi:4'-phosphopantetheinyl transferase EntD
MTPTPYPPPQLIGSISYGQFFAIAIVIVITLIVIVGGILTIIQLLKGRRA